MSEKDRNFSYAESVSLRDYLEARLAAIDVALNLARRGMESRLEGMNEFRNTLRDQASKFMTRAEYEISREKIAEDIKILLSAKDKLEGKASQQAVMISIAVGLTSFFVAVLGLVLRFTRG